MSKPGLILATALLSLVSLPAFSQSCPQYAPSGASLTTSDGCGNGSNPCPVGQPITFIMIPSAPPQACDVVAWNFGDSSTTTTTGVYSVTHTYSTPSGSFVSATIRNSLGSTFASGFFTISNGFLSAGNITVSETVGVAHVPVSRTNGAGTTTVHYATSPGSAVPGYRYTSVSGTLTFSPGETVKTFDVPIIDNSVYDGDQSFFIDLTNPTNGFSLASGSNTVTILEDEKPDVIAFSATSYRASERDGSVTIGVTRTGGLGRTVVVSYFDNTFSSAVLTPVSGTLVFQPGESFKSFVIPITDNNFYDGDFVTQVSLSNPSNGAVLPGNNFSYSVPLTIVDDERPPTYSINDISVVEGNSGTVNATFTITLSAPTRNGATFFLGLSGTATPGIDYAFPNNTSIVVPANATSTTFTLAINGDRDAEPNETMIVTLSACCGGLVAAKSTGTCVILNDDPGMAPATQTLAVGVTGAIVLSVGPPSSTPQVVMLTSSDPSIVSVPQSVTITDATRPITITVKPKKAGGATISATLPPAFGGGVLTARVIAFTPLEIRFNPATLQVGVGETRLVTAVTSPAVGAPLTVALRPTDPTRVEVPATMTFDSSGSATFTVKGLKAGGTAVSANVGSEFGSRNFSLLVDVGDAPILPTIAQVTPSSGPSSGGTLVTISGSNLRAGCSVQFGGIPATDVEATADGSLTALTPAHVAAAVDVVVACGDQSSTLTRGFTFVSSSPSLSSVWPSFGSTSGGTFVRIKGNNLVGGCWPFFGSDVAPSAVFVDPTEILSTTPPHASGRVGIEVRCSASTSASLDNAFSFTAAADPGPVITSVSPLFGAPGDSIQVAGVRFRPHDVVTIGDQPATILVASPDSHIVRVPELSPGTVSVSVGESTGAASTTGPIFTVLEARPPQISSLSRASGPAGAELQVFGTGFRPAYRIAIGDVAATTIALAADHVVVRIPGLSPGAQNVNALNAAGKIAAIGPSFTITASGLNVTAATPSCTTTDGGTDVIVNGSGFQSGATAWIRGVRALSTVVIDSNSIRITVPPVDPGDVTIEVRNPDGDAATLTNGLRYASPFDPNGCPSRTHPTRH